MCIIIHIAGVHIKLQEKLLDKNIRTLKPDEAFLKSFAQVLGSTWPSLATSLSLSASEVEKMKKELKHLSEDEQALHMLKQWASGEHATYSDLLLRLKTIPLFHYSTHADADVDSGPVSKQPSSDSAHKPLSTCCNPGQPSNSSQSPSTIVKHQKFPSIPNDSSQSSSSNPTNWKPQQLSSKVTLSHQLSDDQKPLLTSPLYQLPKHGTSGPQICKEQSYMKNSSPSAQPISMKNDLTSTSWVSQSFNHTRLRKHSLQDAYKPPTKIKKEHASSSHSSKQQ